MPINKASITGILYTPFYQPLQNLPPSILQNTKQSKHQHHQIFLTLFSHVLILFFIAPKCFYFIFCHFPSRNVLFRPTTINYCPKKFTFTYSICYIALKLSEWLKMVQQSSSVSSTSSLQSSTILQ